MQIAKKSTGAISRPRVSVARPLARKNAIKVNAAKNVLTNLIATGQAMAEEAAPAASSANPLLPQNPTEIIILATPVIGYGLFNIARSQNSKLGFSDLLLFIAAAFIVAEIFSIAVFKQRIY